MKKRDDNINMDVNNNNGTSVGNNNGILINNYIYKCFDTLGIVEKLAYTYTDIFSYYLENRFRKAHLTATCSDLSDELKIIETYFINAFTYRMKESKNMVSEYCKKGIDNIISIRNNYEINDAICDGYLDYRKADFELFQGYYLRSNSKWKIIKDAIRDYNSAACKLRIDMGKNEILLESFNYNQDEIKDKLIIYAYMYNTFGECNSMLLQAYKEGAVNVTDEELNIIKMDAIDYCKKAVDYAEKGNCQREVYLRNYGVAIERAYPGDMRRLEQVSELYKKSCMLDDKSNKSFVTYISARLKIIFKILDIADKIIGEERTPQFIILNDKIQTKYMENKGFIDEALIEVGVYLDTVAGLAPNYANVYTLYGKFYMLKGLLNNNVQSKQKLFHIAKRHTERALLLDNHYTGAIAINEDLNELIN